MLRRRALPGVLLAAGCAAPPPPVAGRACGGPHPLWAVGAGWHTEVALPTAALEGGPLAPLLGWLPRARVVMLGFGKRDFFMADPPGLAEWLAAPLPGPAVVRATALGGPPVAGAAHEVVALATDAAGLRGLVDFLAGQLLRDDAGGFAPPVEPPARSRVFFPARERYTLVWNCNRWTAEALLAAGLPVAPAGVLTRGAAMEQARGAAVACA